MRKKDKIIAILVNSEDTWETFKEKFETKYELKKKRCYCRFYLECEKFYVESYPCTHRGGEYCGAFRKFMLNEKKISKIIIKKYDN